MVRLRLAVLALLVLPGLAQAAQPSLSCRIEQSCERGQACTATDTDFELVPVEGGYRATLDLGTVTIRQVSPPEARTRSFLLSNEQSVTVLLSLFPAGEFALSVHEELDGPYVETAFGTCVEDL